LGQYVRFFEDKKNPDRYWINFKYQEHHFEIAIPLHQLGGQPHVIINAIILSGLLLTFISSWFLAYHLNKPIRRMVTAVKQVSNGISPKPIPEQGCKELVVLAESVNVMAKKVKELLENRTIMLAGISHDLRTPLTRMALSVEMLPDADDSILMQHIHKDIALMNEMIGHYMELACCLTEEKPEEHEIYSLLSVYISEIQQHSNVPIDLKTVNTSSEIELDTLRIYPVAFKRIISNLLGNAIRYGEGKPIIVSYDKVKKRGEDWIQISIIDQGPGISEKELERVFHPFYKVDKSRNSKLGGSGLGLAIVSHLAQAHGWHIELNSPESGGLIAQVRLPINH
jgi:two-component system osmolarity sensor histidine kinase EnvZ